MDEPYKVYDYKMIDEYRINIIENYKNKVDTSENNAFKNNK